MIFPNILNLTCSRQTFKQTEYEKAIFNGHRESCFFKEVI